MAMNSYLVDLQHLIYLLDDEDPEIYFSVSQKMISMGQGVLPDLERICWSNHSNHVLQDRLEYVIHKINYHRVKEAFKTWIDNGATDLLEALILIASFQYPDLDTDWINERVDNIYKNIYFKLNLRQTPLMSVSVFNQAFYDIFEFRATNNHLPQSFFINYVLSTKKGDGIFLSILYLIIAQRLKLPIQGVCIPNHLILAYVKDKKRKKKAASDKNDLKRVEFYVNPEDKGAIFTKREIEEYLLAENVPRDMAYFYPCTNKTILHMFLQSLAHAYQRGGELEKDHELHELMHML